MPSTYDNPQNPGLELGGKPEAERLRLEMLRDYAEWKVGVLKRDQPELFRYSDLLGERPIDGFIRQLDVWALDKAMKQDTEYMQRFKQNQTIEQNQQVVPGYPKQTPQGPVM